MEWPEGVKREKGFCPRPLSLDLRSEVKGYNCQKEELLARRFLEAKVARVALGHRVLGKVVFFLPLVGRETLETSRGSKEHSRRLVVTGW